MIQILRRSILVLLVFVVYTRSIQGTKCLQLRRDSYTTYALGISDSKLVLETEAGPGPDLSKASWMGTTISPRLAQEFSLPEYRRWAPLSDFNQTPGKEVWRVHVYSIGVTKAGFFLLIAMSIVLLILKRSARITSKMLGFNVIVQPHRLT